MSQEFSMTPIAHIRSDFAEKFGVPRQSGLVEELEADIVFEPAYQNPDALRAGDGDARRVVAPVFQSGKGVQEKLPGVFKAGISNDSTHIKPVFLRAGWIRMA